MAKGFQMRRLKCEKLRRRTRVHVIRWLSYFNILLANYLTN
jgi:hypothetical protein